MEILVTGASGFVGSHLARALADEGHSVRAMTRRPDDYEGAGTPVAGDVGDPDTLPGVLRGVDVAYYLIHSLDDDDFERKDAQSASAFAAAAAEAGVRRIIYLGGLGAEDGGLSPHLRSRRQVEKILRAGAVPVTVLRAAIIVGHGGVSWEITRQLVKNLPVMIAPRWVDTRTQPIALTDAIRYLVGVLDDRATGETYEIGGPEVMTYAEMLQQAARVRNGRYLPIVSVPVLTPALSSLWIALVTDVDATTARNLIESMSTEVVVRDDRIRELLPGVPLAYDEAVEAALAARRADPHRG